MGVLIDIFKDAVADPSAVRDRDALLNQIDIMMGQPLTAAEIKQLAVDTLGHGLSADRCMSFVIDRPSAGVRIVSEWCRPGLATLAFQNCNSQIAVDLDGAFAAGERPVVVHDIRSTTWSQPTTEGLATMGIRSLVGVPMIVDGDQVEMLCVAMAEHSRDWTADEVTRIEQMALLTRTAVEAVQASQREHKIAAQLQAALLPKLPRCAPGLELADYYRPAFEESEVGGDFADVFTVDNGITFFVVGDVSGKGLAAAAQIAMVRNMLRFALYHGRTLAGPVTSLNRMLAENNMLEGFVTVFVARYDPRARTVTYVNCGQEPGLVRHAATGLIEELPPTGPVVGTIETAVFQEEVVRLDSGDSLVMFTDGFTEVGPSRHQQLGIEGLKVLLQGPYPSARDEFGSGRADHLLDRMIAGVDAYSRGGSRDDMCMLVGVVDD